MCVRASLFSHGVASLFYIEDPPCWGCTSLLCSSSSIISTIHYIHARGLGQPLRLNFWRLACRQSRELPSDSDVAGECGARHSGGACAVSCLISLFSLVFVPVAMRAKPAAFPVFVSIPDSFAPLLSPVRLYALVIDCKCLLGLSEGLHSASHPAVLCLCTPAYPVSGLHTLCPGAGLPVQSLLRATALDT